MNVIRLKKAFMIKHISHKTKHCICTDWYSLYCLGPIGDFCIGDGEKNNYTRDASRCLAILSINTSRLFAEGSVIPPEHRLMLVNFHRECIGDAKKSPVGPRHTIQHITISTANDQIKNTFNLHDLIIFCEQCPNF